MKRLSILGLLIVTASLVSGCYKPPQNNPPNVESDLEKILAQFNLCDKSDKEQPLTEELMKSAITVEGTVEIKDFEVVDCGEKVMRKGRGPVKAIEKKIQIDAPASLKEKVTSMVVHNHRTCTSKSITIVDDSLVEGYDMADGSKLKPLENWSSSFAGDSGKLVLGLINSEDKSYFSLNVLDGNNALEIKYYGNCLKYKPDAKKDASEEDRCQEAELLATKSVLVQVNVKKTEVEGLRKIDICREDKNANEP